MSMDDPKVYSKYTQMTSVSVEEFLEEIKDQIKWREKEYVLDVGCGPGDVTVNVLRKYLPKNSKIIGGDISEEMIKYAKQNFIINNVTFEIVDICNRHLRSTWDEEFTKIFSFFCLHRVKQRDAYQNIFHLLKPGGQLISIVIVDFDWFVLSKYLAKHPVYSKYKEELMSIVNGETFREDTIKLLKSIGFRITWDTITEKKFFFQTLDEAYEFFQSINFLPHILSPKAILEALKEILEGPEETRILRKTEKGFEFNYVLHSFVGTKPFAWL